MNRSKVSNVPAIEKMRLDKAVEGMMNGLQSLPCGINHVIEFNGAGSYWKLTIQRIGPEREDDR